MTIEECVLMAREIHQARQESKRKFEKQLEETRRLYQEQVEREIVREVIRNIPMSGEFPEDSVKVDRVSMVDYLGDMFASSTSFIKVRILSPDGKSHLNTTVRGRRDSWQVGAWEYKDIFYTDFWDAFYQLTKDYKHDHTD